MWTQNFKLGYDKSADWYDWKIAKICKDVFPTRHAQQTQG